MARRSFKCFSFFCSRIYIFYRKFFYTPTERHFVVIDIGKKIKEIGRFGSPMLIRIIISCMHVYTMERSSPAALDKTQISLEYLRQCAASLVEQQRR
jgi:hypothetical protein